MNPAKAAAYHLSQAAAEVAKACRILRAAQHDKYGEAFTVSDEVLDLCLHLERESESDETAAKYSGPGDDLPIAPSWAVEDYEF